MTATGAAGPDALPVQPDALPAAQDTLYGGQYRFVEAQVVRSRRLGPTLTRITFGGEQLARLAAGGRDQSFSLFLPHPGQPAPVLPVAAGEDWFARWRALDPAVRAVMRAYTIRAHRPEPAEVDVDFALHGTAPGDPPEAAGPASRWAAAARPGDRVVLLGPALADNRSVGFRPPPDAERVLIVADETALPAVGGILEWLPATARVTAFIEVPHPQDVQHLACAGEAEISWLVRDTTEGSPVGGSLVAGSLLSAVRAARLPEGAPYAWIAGEAGMVRAVRRHLVRERGIDRRSVFFSGYWRRGASEEQLRAERPAGEDSTG